MRSPHKSVLRHFAAALLMALVTLSVGAYAQVDIFESGQNAELSEKLFTEGRSLWKKGKHLEACAKFRQSFEAAQSVGNLLNLGRCDERQGKLASAHRYYAAAAKLAAQSGSDRKDVAEKLATGLALKLASVTVTVPSPVPGMMLRLNDTPLQIDKLGKPQLIDPGQFTVSASASGYQPFSKAGELAAGVKETVTVQFVALDAAPRETAPPPAPPPTTTATSPPPPPPPPGPDEPDEGGLSGVQIAGFVIGGVGLLGVAIGSLAGVAALGDEAAAEDECDQVGTSGQFVCPADKYDYVENAETYATVSTVSFILGGVLTAAGLALVIFGGDGDSEAAGAELAPLVSPEVAGLQLLGRF